MTQSHATLSLAQEHPSIAGDLASAARLQRFARHGFTFAAVVGALVLLGWQLPSHPLSHHTLMMKPTSALGFILLGVGLRFRLAPNDEQRRSRLMAVAVCLLGVELLALHGLLEHAFAYTLDLDERLVPAFATPGHMSPAAAVDLALMGIVGAWLSDDARVKQTVPMALTSLALFLALGALAGHGYGVRREHAMGMNPMVPLTAFCFAVICLSVLSARVPPDVASLLASRTPSSVTVRRLLLGLISIPVALGFVERFLHHQGVYETEFGVAMLMVANMLLLFTLTIRNMRVLLAAQRERARLERDLEQNRELTERYQAQQALQRSEEKYRALAVHAPVGIFEATLDGRCTFVNERWTDITGYSEAEALGRGWDKAVHPDDFGRLMRVWGDAMQAGKPFSLDFRYCTKKREVAWVHGAAVPLKDDQGKVTGLMGTVVDMTERRRTLEALSKSEENFRSLVERAPFGVLVLRELNVIYANQCFLSMLGYGEMSEVVSKHLTELLHPEARDIALQRERDRNAGIALQPATVRAIRKDHSLISVESDSAFMVFDGEPAVVALVRDVTERERVEQVRLLAEQTMRDSLREKDVLLKEVHHRVKNNLQVIVSLINLQASKLEDSATRSVFEETRSRVHAIALLHERLYSSKSIGQIDMRDYLDGLASDLSSSNAGTRPVELRVHADELYLEMDSAVPIGLIVNELVTNSYKHAFPERLRRGGRIEIALERSGSELQIVVQDDGVGYQKEIDPDSADTLGLLLISSLSRQLDGDLRFERRSDGARCVVRFPRKSREESLPVPAAAS